MTGGFLGRGGGGGGGGSGFVLRAPPDTFNGATKDAAILARDDATTGITDTAPWDDDPNLAIILTWPVVVTNTIYQVRRGDAWVDAVNTIRGPVGAGGAAGTPGGGALVPLSSFAVTIGGSNDDMFLALGFDWPDDGFMAYTAGGRMYWLRVADVLAVTASTAGTASAAATRNQIPEPFTGLAYLGRTAANGALIEFSASAGAVVMQFYTYVPGSIADAGAILAALQGYLTAGSQTGISVTLTDAGALDIDVRPDGTHTSQYIAVKATNNSSWPTSLEPTGPNGRRSPRHVIPDLAGDIFVAVARLATDPAPTFVEFDDGGLNVITAFAEATDTLDVVAGSAYNIWITSAAADYGARPLEFR